MMESERALGTEIRVLDPEPVVTIRDRRVGVLRLVHSTPHNERLL